MSIITKIEPQIIPLWPDASPGIIESMGKEEIVHRSEVKLDRAIKNVCCPTLTYYLPPDNINTGTAIIVCPGGGFKYLAIDKSGHDIAQWLVTYGISAFVLSYRTSPYERSVAFQDGRRAIKLVRSQAEEWGIDPNLTGFMGFSAGGHIASALLDEREFNNDDPIDQYSSRPNFMCLFYGNDKSKVTPHMPPTFIVHATDDIAVPVSISVDYFQALLAVGVSAEMHVFAKGGHGFGMELDDGNTHMWSDLLISWLRNQSMLGET